VAQESPCYPRGLLWGMIVAVGFQCTPTYSLAQESIPDEWMNKWREYEFFSRSLQGKALYTGLGLVSGKTYSYPLSYRQNSHCAMICSSFDSKDQSIERCLFANLHYAAEIQRKRDDPQNVVLRDRRQDPNAILSVFKLPLIDEVFVATSPHFTYCNTRLLEVVKRPSFQVKRITKESLDGYDLVRIDHSYIHDESHTDQKIQSQRQGSIYFDPSRGWCIRRIKESEVYLLNGKRDHNTWWDIQYDVIDHPSGFPIIKTQTMHTKGSKNRNGVEQKHEGKVTMDYQLTVDDHVPDSDFTLSAFGLPEPQEMEKNRTYLWIFTAAAICLALSLGFRYLARRKRLCTS
jgi:hypothetical protein